jgi:two-component system OmpR family response regulator
MENKRVCLVVEDDNDIRGLISVVLQRAGFEVRAVSTGAEGIAAAADPAVALVTLDLGLPDMDGHVVARAIRALSKAPQLFLTARSEEDDVLAGMASPQQNPPRRPSLRRAGPVAVGAARRRGG